MKCANCGNTNPKTLHDEDDTFYCSNCTHRTYKSNGKDAVVLCPVCHYPRDPKAAYCRWCNDSTWGKYNPQEEKSNKESQQRLTEDSLVYKKYRDYDSKRSRDFVEDDQPDSSVKLELETEDIGLAVAILTFVGAILGKLGIEFYKNHKNKRKNANKKDKKKFSLKEKIKNFKNKF